MMEFLDFKTCLKQSVKLKLYDYEDVLENEVLKNNSILLDSLVISSEKSNVTPNFYLRDFYERFKNGETIDELAVNIVNTYHDNVDASKYEELNISYPMVKNKIVPRLISKDKNDMILKTSPHIDYMNLSMVFHIMVEQDECGQSSIRINNAIMDSWKSWRVTEKKLEKIAMENIMKINPPTIQNMRETLTYLCESINKEVPDFLTEESMFDNDFFVISSERQLNGSVYMFNKKVIKELREKFKDDFFILPSSIHEVIALRRMGNEFKMLKEMVLNVNTECLNPMDVLSDNVYLYDYEKDEYEIFE